MKILILTSGTPSSSLSHRMAAMGRTLVRRGHSVTMMAPSSDRHSNWNLDRPDQKDGIQMVYPTQLRTKSFILNLLPYLVSASFKMLRLRADIVIICKPTPAVLPGLLAKWLRRTPIVLDLDDLGSEVMAIEGHPKFMWKLVAWCERLIAASADGIVVASKLLERELGSRHPYTPLIRLSNGVDPHEFEPVPGGINRQPRIIFFGMLSRTSILGAVFEALPSVLDEVGRDRLVVEVLGDGSKRTELTAMASHLGISDNVSFRGWTRFEEVGEYAKAYDIAMCIMPPERTTAACSNQKVFQYQALELVTVVTRVGDLPEYVEEGAAGVVVEPGDRAQLSRILIELIRDPARRRAIAARGRELATTRHSWDRLGGELESFLERLK